MRNIFFTFLLLILFTSVTHSQSRERAVGGANYFSINNEDNILKYKFTFTNNELLWSKIFITNNRVSIPYCLKDSSSTIYTYSSDLTFRRWSNTSRTVGYNTASSYVSPVFTTLYGAKSYPIYVFYGDSVLYYSYLENSRSQWISNSKLFIALGSDNSVIGVISATSSRTYVLVNTKDEDGVNSVVKVYSGDNGFTWASTSIAVRHNTRELKGWCISSPINRPLVSYMILTDNNSMPYCSVTVDGGVTWSYPRRISNSLRGDSYNMVIDNGYFVVTFRRITDGGVADHNDMILWHGTQPEFMGEQRRGNMMKIADNQPDDESSEFTIEDIAYYKNRQYFVLIKNRQEGNTDLQVHLIRRTNTK